MSELPEAGEGKRGMEGHLGYLLRQASQAHRNRVERALADLDLTLPQFSVLTMLAAYPGHSNADMARLALLTPQTMSVIVANLLKAQLIVRAPHQIHGRIQKIALTDAGQSLLDTAKRRVYALEADMLDDMDATEQAIVRQWLVRIARSDAR